jgi:DNA-directed RNA polymerase specialized sigma24 family protein
MAIIGSLEIASKHGYQARNISLPIRNEVSTSRTGVDVLGSLLKRISDLELSMDELDTLKDNHGGFVQQADLISFVSGSLRSEAKLARMLLRVSDAQIPLGALMRTLEAMTDRINNFWATISAWRPRLSAEVVSLSKRVRAYMRRVLRGARTAIKWINRAQIRDAQVNLEQIGGPDIETQSISQQITMNVPLMRRYARALLGSQSAGDAYVGSTIDAILLRRNLLSDKYNVRLGLFKVLHDFVSQFGIHSTEDDSVPDKAKALQRLPLRMRETFFLSTIEGFSELEVATILGVEVETIRNELTDFGLALAKEIATRVMIIDPDTESFAQISSVVTALGHQVLPSVDTGEEVLALAKAQSPGLIISEVQMKHGESGLNVVNAALRHHQVPTIFVTAYPERFLTGPRPEPSFLISKPFVPSMLSAVISQALFFDRRSRPR